MPATTTSCSDCIEKDFDLAQAARQITELREKLASRMTQVAKLTEENRQLKEAVETESARRPTNKQLRKACATAIRRTNVNLAAYMLGREKEAKPHQVLSKWREQEAAAYDD